jgi:hypothetical protein
MAGVRVFKGHNHGAAVRNSADSFLRVARFGNSPVKGSGGARCKNPDRLMLKV